ncbi:MAG: hypothetical protein ACTHOK_12170 [Nocardioidaceae bacterium]
MWKAHRARRQLERAAALAASAGLVFTAAGCAQPHPTLDELRQVPEVSLLPAGAVLVRRGGVDSDRKNFGGVNPAILSDLYATDDAPAAVFAFYRDHLGDGWVEDRNAGVMRTEWADADAWESAGYLFQVGVENADYRNRAAAVLPRAAGKTTLFELSLQARD